MDYEIHNRSIQLQLWGTADEPLSGSALVNAILDDPAAPQKLESVPSVWLHRLVCEVGMADIADLLELASAEQVREILDLELWHGDRLDLDEALEWVHFLTTLPEHAAFRHLRGLDVELMGLLLLHHVRIYLVEEENVPDEPEGLLFPTPDGWFVLEIMVATEADAQKIIAVVNTLYRDDLENIRRLLQNLMWEFSPELEEWCLRWRNNRMADLGFASPAEALELYAYLAPTSVQPATEQTADRPLRQDPEHPGQTPLVVLAGSSEDSFFSRVLGLVEGDAEEQLLSQILMALGNRSLAADRVDPADADAARLSLDQLRWRLSLGLEFLAERQPERGLQVLSQVALMRIARVGHSLTLDLRRRLLPFQRQGLLGRKPGQADLLDPPLRQQISALLLPRPRLWEPPPGQARPFRTLDDLNAATRQIDELERTLALVRRVQLTVELPPEVTHGGLVRTLVVNRLLQRQGAVDRPALQRFLSQYVQDGQLAREVWQTAHDLLQPDDPSRTIVDDWIDTLQQTLAPLDPADLELRYLEGLWFDR